MVYLLNWLPSAWRRPLLQLAAMPLGRKLVRGALASLVMTGISMLLGIVTSVLLARTLGPERYGLYSFAMILAGIASVPFWFGMSTLLTREVGRVMATGVRADMNLLIRWCYFWTARGALIVTIVAAGLLLAAASELGPERLLVSLVALPLIGLSMLMPVNSTLLRGLGGLVRSQFCDLVFRPLLGIVIFLGLFALVGSSSLGASTALVAQIIAVAGAAVLSGWWLFLGYHEIPADRPTGPAVYQGRFRFRTLIAFSAYATLASVYGSIDSLMLNALDGNATLGVYRIAMIGVQLMTGFTSAINTIVQPTIASLHAAGDRPRLQRLLTANARATLALAAVPAAVLALFAEPLLRIGFGTAYTAGAPALSIAAVGQLVIALAGPAANLLTMTGHERTALRCLLAGTVLNGALCTVLIPGFGISGAAFATTAGGLLFVGLMSISERRLTGLTSSVFGSP